MAEIKLFISSVQKEFANERRLLCDYIRTDGLLGRFFVPFIFEDMPASEVSAQKAYLMQAAECHIYLGIFGTQYGYEDAEGISPTEREQPQKVSDLESKSNQAPPKSNQVEPKSNGAEQKSNQVRLTAKQRKVLEFCDVIPRTAQEILEMVGVKYQTKTREQYVNKLVEAGLLRPTTVHRNASNRRYITAHSSTER